MRVEPNERTVNKRVPTVITLLLGVLSSSAQSVRLATTSIKPTIVSTRLSYKSFDATSGRLLTDPATGGSLADDDVSLTIAQEISRTDNPSAAVLLLSAAEIRNSFGAEPFSTTLPTYFLSTRITPPLAESSPTRRVTVSLEPNAASLPRIVREGQAATEKVPGEVVRLVKQTLQALPASMGLRIDEERGKTLAQQMNRAGWTYFSELSRRRLERFAAQRRGFPDEPAMLKRLHAETPAAIAIHDCKGGLEAQSEAYSLVRRLMQLATSRDQRAALEAEKRRRLDCLESAYRQGREGLRFPLYFLLLYGSDYPERSPLFLSGLQAFDEALRAEPRSSEAYFNSGYWRLNLVETKNAPAYQIYSALEYLEKAFQWCPFDPNPYGWIGKARGMLCDWEGASEAFAQRERLDARAGDLAPKNPAARSDSRNLVWNRYLVSAREMLWLRQGVDIPSQSRLREMESEQAQLLARLEELGTSPWQLARLRTFHHLAREQYREAERYVVEMLSDLDGALRKEYVSALGLDAVAQRRRLARVRSQAEAIGSDAAKYDREVLLALLDARIDPTKVRIRVSDLIDAIDRDETSAADLHRPGAQAGAAVALYLADRSKDARTYAEEYRDSFVPRLEVSGPGARCAGNPMPETDQGSPNGRRTYPSSPEAEAKPSERKGAPR